MCVCVCVCVCVCADRHVRTAVPLCLCVCPRFPSPHSLLGRTRKVVFAAKHTLMTSSTTITAGSFISSSLWGRREDRMTMRKKKKNKGWQHDWMQTGGGGVQERTHAHTGVDKARMHNKRAHLLCAGAPRPSAVVPALKWHLND